MYTPLYVLHIILLLLPAKRCNVQVPCSLLESPKEQYANFVSWLDISERTWTIDRVFLNGILPAGHRYGAQAIAEHLLAPPLLFFQSKKESQSSCFEEVAKALQALPNMYGNTKSL